MFIVFDLDGTLADCEHRIHHITKEPKDWDSFFAACAGDVPIPATIAVLRALANSSDQHRVEIWSGRSDQAASETEGWLRDYVFDGCDQGIYVRMRAAGDHRNDDILKAEWIEHHGKPDLVFEDRARVVAMWRRLGVQCFQVAPGEF